MKLDSMLNRVCRYIIQIDVLRSGIINSGGRMRFMIGFYLTLQVIAFAIVNVVSLDQSSTYAAPVFHPQDPSPNSPNSPGDRSNTPKEAHLNSSSGEENALDRAENTLRHSAKKLRSSIAQLEKMSKQHQLNLQSQHRSDGNSKSPTGQLRSSTDEIRMKRKLTQILGNLEIQIKEVNAQFMMYYQAPRSPHTKRSPASLRLRREVWSLLHFKHGLYQHSEGRFCLRASSRNLIANAYQVLGQTAKSSRHLRHAQACPPLPINPEVD